MEWENAWNEHTKKWTPPEKQSNFMTAQEGNKRKGPIIGSLISGDLREIVDHPHLFLGCQYETDDDIDYDGKRYSKFNSKWTTWTDRQILEAYADDGGDFVYGDKLGYINHRQYSHWPCSVLRATEDGKYTVRIHQSPLESKQTETTIWEQNNVPRILTNYQRESIRYFVKPTSQDHTLPGAFRHHVGVPVGIFPEHWKNLK